MSHPCVVLPNWFQTVLKKQQALKRAPRNVRFQNGFTLIEVLVVVLIIGILAAVALPQYEKAVYKTRISRVLPLLRAIVHAERAFYMANGRYTDADFDALDITLPEGCTFTVRPEFGYNQIHCTDLTINVEKTGSLGGLILKCPKKSSWCVRYNMYYDANKRDTCEPTLNFAEGTAYGREICKSLGGLPNANETLYTL